MMKIKKKEWFNLYLDFRFNVVYLYDILPLIQPQQKWILMQKQDIQELQLQPETAPKAETAASNINKTPMAIFAGNINGLRAITSQQSLLKAAAITVISRLLRTFSTRNIEGN